MTSGSCRTLAVGPSIFAEGMSMNTIPNSLAARDITTLVHPYTNLEKHKSEGPRIMKRGKGVRVQDDNGKWYLEGMAGLWCASLGFDEPRLVEVAAKQMAELPYYAIFNHASHQPAIELSERLLAIAPKGLTKVLYANSGSEANDSAVKMVWYYNNAIGRPQKKKIIGRFRGYHGVTVASASMTGQEINHKDWDLPLPGFLHTDCPSYFHYALPGESEEQFATRLAQNLEELILREGPETVAAFIAEPVNGGGGVIVPPATYFAKIQAVLKKYDVLFIADEVICGFGRTGNMFGCETFGIVPDMMTVAKALSASFLPISGLLMTEEIFEAIARNSDRLGTFGHGVTYAAHPVCAAVAAETLKIYEERDILGHVRSVAPRLQEGIRGLLDHPLIGNARGVGLIGAVEPVKDKATNEAFPVSEKVGQMIQQAAWERGIIVRGMRGDGIAFCPPLIINQAEIDELVAGVRGALDDVAGMLSSRGLWREAA